MLRGSFWFSSYNQNHHYKITWKTKTNNQCGNLSVISGTVAPEAGLQSF